ITGVGDGRLSGSAANAGVHRIMRVEMTEMRRGTLSILHLKLPTMNQPRLLSRNLSRSRAYSTQARSPRCVGVRSRFVAFVLRTAELIHRLEVLQVRGKKRPCAGESPPLRWPF